MSLARRSFLRMATFGCAYCLAKAAGADPGGGHEEAAHAKPHWSYEGETGPEHWGELSADFKSCQLGLEQTPIDLTSGVSAEVEGASFDYAPLPLRIVNNGHTIQVNADPGCSCTIGGARYELLQFHFHHPSEHLLDGNAFDLEAHFVHKSAAGALAVVGVFFKPGAHNFDLAPIFDQMPKSEGPEIQAQGKFDPKAFFPKSRDFFRYVGSLTTPPCSEGLLWTVFREPVEASPQQIRQFAALFGNNARPVQKRHSRFLLDARS